MKTTELINGFPVNIEWEFVEKTDDLDGAQWAEYSVEGIGSNGKQYAGTCQGSGIDPNDFHADVTDIEEL